jgi:hypothetical protein
VLWSGDDVRRRCRDSPRPGTLLSPDRRPRPALRRACGDHRSLQNPLGRPHAAFFSRYEALRRRGYRRPIVDELEAFPLYLCYPSRGDESAAEVIFLYHH